MNDYATTTIDIIEGVNTYEEGVNVVAKCFGYWDANDPSCSLRCKSSKECEAGRAEMLPSCYGTHRPGIECVLCLEASACTDVTDKSTQKGDSTMPKILIRHKPAVAKPVEPAAEEVAAEEVAAEEEPVVAETEFSDEDVKKTDYWALEIPDLRVEAQGRGLDYAGTKLQLCRRLLESDMATGEETAVEEPVVAAPKPVLKPVLKPALQPALKLAPKPVVKPVAVVAKPALQPAPRPVQKAAVPSVPKTVAVLDAGFWTKAWEHMEAGKVLTLTMEESGEINVRLGTAAVAVAGKKAARGSGKAYEEEVLSDAFKNFAFVDAGTGHGKGWTQLTREEKYEFAAANTIEWEHHENEQMDTIRMSEAVRTAFGIEKYKEEYATRAARDALKASMGM